MKILEMRIPTDKEYDKLCDICNEDNAKMHWRGVSSFVEGSIACGIDGNIARGFSSARKISYWENTEAYFNLGFRPAFETMDISKLSRDVIDGKEPAVIGTLYMDERPIPVPLAAIYTTDYQKYATFTIREPLADPQYQVCAFHIGEGVFVADHALVSNLSHNTLLFALNKETPQEEKKKFCVIILKTGCVYIEAENAAEAQRIVDKHASASDVTWDDGFEVSDAYEDDSIPESMFWTPKDD